MAVTRDGSVTQLARTRHRIVAAVLQVQKQKCLRKKLEHPFVGLERTVDVDPRTGESRLRPK